MQMSAAEFKSKCLKMMDHVRDCHEEIIITKHGKPVAKLVPVETKAKKSVFGFMKNSVTIHEDIIEPIGEQWDADDGEETFS